MRKKSQRRGAETPASRPQRPRSHEVGDAAVVAFKFQCPERWVCIESTSDYGWDLLVTIPSAPGTVGDDFFVQVKGSDKVHYLTGSSELTHSLEVTTINWLLDKPEPTMLAVCDMAHKDRPVYWVWLSEAVNSLNQKNPSWRKQRSVSLKIPLSNRLNAENWNYIEQYLREWHRDRRIEKRIVQYIRPALPPPPPSELGISEDLYVKQKVLPSFQQVGLVSITETETGTQVEAYNQEDQERRKKLQEAGIFLNAFQDAAASRILDALAPEIKEAVSSIRSMYHNCKGILALHEGKMDEAAQAFRHASVLQPKEPKYIVNLLIVQYKEGRNEEPIPSDWDARLASVLTSQPDFGPAIRLRAYRLADLEGLNAAEGYVRTSALWKTSSGDALTLLVDIAREASQLDRALEFANEAERVNSEHDAFFYSLKGLILFHQAVGATGKEQLLNIRGLGPAALQVKKLQQSAEAYRKSCLLFAQKGYPKAAEETVQSAMIVLVLLGHAMEAEDIARGFLKLHPDSSLVSGVLALAFLHKGESNLAIPYAHQAFATEPDSSLTYINLLLVLLHADDYDSLLEAAHKRQEEGFRNQDEERLSRLLSAKAYAERGEFSFADMQIEKLREHKESYADSIVAESFVSRLRGRSKEQILARLREHLCEMPNDPKILTVFVHNLFPPNKHTAEEIIDVLVRLKEHRQLSPEEIWALGHAFLIREAIEEAEVIFRSGRVRYPGDPRFLVEHAQVLARLGKNEEAYEEMKEYLRLNGHSEATYRNIGVLAETTGRLDEAIRMFQSAVSREKDTAVREQLHCMLFNLRRRRGDPPKEILRHAMFFGQTTREDVEKEAQFLTMCLLTPSREKDVNDPEVQDWIKEFRSRLANFTDAYPKFKSLRKFEVPLDLPPEEQGLYILSDLAAQTLPARLAKEQAELAARGTPWPLSTRKNLVSFSQSIFEYWETCSDTKEASHALHIWFPLLDFSVETSQVDLHRPVCIDITALLTLEMLELLDEVVTLFPEVVLARGTVRAVRTEFVGFRQPHRLATRLDQWITNNKRVVRVRPVPGVASSDLHNEVSYRKEGSLWTHRQRTVAELIGDGVGESLLLAAQAGLPLYCDDVALRIWARDEFHIRAFSTLALLAHLRRANRLSLANEARCLAKLISLNYRIVPFESAHLHESLLAMLETEGTNRELRAEALHKDDTLGVLLRQFSDRELSNDVLVRMAYEWWLKLLRTPSISEQTCQAIVNTLTFALSQRVDEGILTGVSPEKPLQAIASLWSPFLVKVYCHDRELLRQAWSLLKSCAEERFRHDQGQFQHVLYELIPDAVCRWINKYPALRGNEKLLAVVSLPQYFGEEDRLRFESRISQRTDIIRH